MPAAKNEQIKAIVTDTEFRKRIVGGVIRRAEAIAAEATPDAAEATWAADISRDPTLLARRSSAVDSMAEMVVSADMTANPTRSPQEITAMPQSQLDAYIVTYSAFFAANPPVS